MYCLASHYLDFFCETEMNVGDSQEYSFSTVDSMLRLVLV